MRRTHSIARTETHGFLVRAMTPQKAAQFLVMWGRLRAEFAAVHKVIVKPHIRRWPKKSN